MESKGPHSLTEHVQSKREIEALLDEAGLHPRKRFGQHFLIDGNLMRMLVQSAEIGPTDSVLEVGPGTGGLTDLLVAGAGRVICVEIDKGLFSIISRRFADQPNVRLICGDVLDGKHKLNANMIAVLKDASEPIKLVANLPYDAATPLLMNLVLRFPAVSRFCFTVQAEVGARIIAECGTKVYGPLGIILQTFCTIHQVARLGPQAFWPRPLVDSVMLRMDRLPSPPLPLDHADAFASFVHHVFEFRRKQLGSALAYVVENSTRVRMAKVVDPTIRAEQVEPPKWIELFQVATSRHDP